MIHTRAGGAGDLATDAKPPAASQHQLRAWILRHRRTPLGIDVACTVASAFAGFLVALWSLKLWQMQLGVPLTRFGDVDSTMATLKNLDQHWWYWSTSHLGFPFGQDLHDFPAAADTLNLLFAKFVGLFTDSPAVMMNVFFIASYPLVAAAGFAGSRLIGLRRGISVLVGVVYTALPFHTDRFQHLFLANYTVLPLGAALILRQAGVRPLIRQRRGARLRGYLHRDSVIGTSIVVASAMSGLYYAVFICLFLLLAAALAWLRNRRRAALVTVSTVVAIGLLVLVQLVPTILYQRSHGANEITTRSATEIDRYPLRLSVMLLPVYDHRFSVVRDWRDKHDIPSISSEGFGEAMGAFGATGFLVAGGLLAATVARRRRVRWAARVVDAPLFVIFGVLLGSYSSLAAIFGAFGFTQLRAWTRISVFIAFFCIVTLAAWLGRWTLNRKQLGIALLPALVLAAVWDQTSADSAPDYGATAAAWHSEEAFYRGIETTLGSNAAVFQLPVADFPESPAVGQLSGYIHDDTLRWSFGGIKGREADWRERLDPTSDEFVDDLLITGFTGLTVVQSAYSDHGAAIDAKFRQVGVTSTARDADQGVVFYDLRPARAELDRTVDATAQHLRRAALLGQPRVQLTAGFSAPLDIDGVTKRAVNNNATLTVNRSNASHGPGVIRLRISAVVNGQYLLKIRADGADQTFDVSDKPQDVDVKVQHVDQNNRLIVSTDAPLAASSEASSDVERLSATESGPVRSRLILSGLPTLIMAGSS